MGLRWNLATAARWQLRHAAFGHIALRPSSVYNTRHWEYMIRHWFHVIGMLLVTMIHTISYVQLVAIAIKRIIST